MSRKILFKAKRVDNGEWIEGSLIQGVFVRCADNQDIPYILNIDDIDCDYDNFGDLTDGFGYYEVDPNTICQYTGLTDKNGNKIWENDIVDTHVFHEIAEGWGTHVRERGMVCYDKIGMLSIAIDITDGIPCYSDILFQAEIAGIGIDIEQIGNIFDNPDLLKQQ